MSIDKVSNPMQITEKQLSYTIKRTDTDVEIKLNNNCEPFHKYFTHERIMNWLP